MKEVWIVQRAVFPDSYEIVAVTSTREKAGMALKAKAGSDNGVYRHIRNNVDAFYAPGDATASYYIERTQVDDPYFFIGKEEKE